MINPIRGGKRPFVRLKAGRFMGALLSVVCASCAGCATSGYLTDRLRDGADIFTVSVGKGIGIQARVGPVHAGVIGVGDQTGLRGGQIYPLRSSKGPSFIDSGAFGGDYCLGVLGFEYLKAQAERPAGWRHKEFETMFCVVPTGEALKGGKPVVTASYWTQVEVVAAVGVSLRLGFNPGELLDFWLGWVGLDIYDDDVEARRKTEQSHQPAPGEPAPDR